MEILSSVLQYSNVKQQEQIYSNSNVTVDIKNIFNNLSDIIPDDDYRPFYASRYRILGYKRFMELANKARAGRQPIRLFVWMLKNNEIVH